ncbi:MAG: transposase [Candidatus Omnitrophica bacterium]|nr:transposase [Candidatus Omnitrophota bacterium]
MPRIARAVAVEYPHHITQRGNYRQKIFSSDTDYNKYISLLKDEAARYHLTITAYCLMSTHVHFIAIPQKEDSMGKVFKYVNMKYSQYYNKKLRISGHLFQGRFFSCIMDERHTMACARYIERNPVRAKMVNKPYIWKWSSAKVHCGMNKYDELRVNKLFNYIEYDQKGWKEFIESPDNPDEVKQIRESTRKGRPLGSNDFVEKLEGKLNRFLRLKPKGRPKKK